MLDKVKVAEVLASKSSSETPVGGPPGKPIAIGAKSSPKPGENKVVKKALAKLIGASVVPDAEPPVAKPSSKKAVKWLIKKLGFGGANEMANGNGMSLKKYALAMYTEHLAKKKEKPIVQVNNSEETHAAIDAGMEPGVLARIMAAPKNDAMDALANGAAKRKAKKEETEEQQRDKEIQTQLTKLKVSTDEVLKSALHTFMDGPAKAVLEAFVALYVSRNTEGDSDEAVLALDACREAFDACGLMLTDVETRSKTEKKRSKADVAAEAKMQAIAFIAGSKTKKTKDKKHETQAEDEAEHDAYLLSVTKEQLTSGEVKLSKGDMKQRKILLDRKRRADKKKKKSKK